MYTIWQHCVKLFIRIPVWDFFFPTQQATSVYVFVFLIKINHPSVLPFWVWIHSYWQGSVTIMHLKSIQNLKLFGKTNFDIRYVRPDSHMETQTPKFLRWWIKLVNNDILKYTKCLMFFTNAKWYNNKNRYRFSHSELKRNLKVHQISDILYECIFIP